MSVNDVKPGIYASLIKVANHFVQKMEAKIDQVNAPKAIKNATSIDSPQENENGQSIDIVIDLNKETGAPMAGAYEWGSGEHATRGTPNKYIITPSNAKVLAIPASRWPNKLYEDDPAFLKKVYHPGVAARPYIQPTIEEEADAVVEILATDFKASILRGEARIEVIK